VVTSSLQQSPISSLPGCCGRLPGRLNPDEMYAHGLNERVPIKAFYDALDHWSIILRELAGN